MKQNKKFIVIVISIILMSALLLTGCLQAVINANIPPKNYDISEMDYSGCISEIIAGAPISQAEMQEKFSVYNLNAVYTMDGRYGARTETGRKFFTIEQAQELREKRQANKLETLSYDEILFIINDSITQYFSNDFIILTNANEYGYIPEARKQSAADQYIWCYHGDYLEYITETGVDFDKAIERYGRMKLDIWDIITYRIAMLDPSFVRADVYYSKEDDYYNAWLVLDGCSPVSLYGTGDYSSDIAKYDAPTDVYWFKSFIRENMDKTDYLKLIAQQWEVVQSYYRDIYQPIEVEQAAWNTDFLILRNGVNEIYHKGSNILQLYPTEEIENMFPFISESYFTEIVKKLYPEYDISKTRETFSKSYFQKYVLVNLSDDEAT